MNPQTALTAAIVVVVLFQFIAAVMVLRAANERPDLTGAQKYVPVIIALLVPVIGPFIAGRATDSGMRPMLASLLGVAGGFILFASGGGVTTTSQPQVAQAPAEQNPALANPVPTDGTQPAAQPEAAQPEPAAQPEAQPAPAPQPAPQPQPAAQPEPQPSAPAAQPAPAADSPAVTIAEAPDAAAAGLSATADVAADAEAETVPGYPPATVRAGQPRVAGQLILGDLDRDARMEEWISRSPLNNTRLTFAAAVTSPPRTFLQDQLYLGGKVYYFNLLADSWDPYPLTSSTIHEGQTLYLSSRTGTYQAEVRFSDVQQGEGGLTGATIDVQIR